MKILSLSHRIFALLRCQKALRTTVLVLGLLFSGHSIFSQVTVRLYDSYTGILEESMVVCLDRPSDIPGVFQIRLLITRAIGMDGAGVNWGSSAVTWFLNGDEDEFVDVGWTVPFATTVGSNDIVTLQVNYNPAEVGSLNAILGGTFRAEWGGFYATIDIHLRPIATPVDTIFTDPILCQGTVARFWTEVGGHADEDSYFDQFNRYFIWDVYDASGNLVFSQGVAFPSNLPSNQISELLIPNFNPELHHTIAVRRSFCNHVGLIGATGRRFSLDLEDHITISNPPLGSGEDTLFRLAWLTPVLTGEPGDDDDDRPRWTSIPMQSPVCVNYGSDAVVTGPNSVPTGFVRTIAVDDIALSSGFLFFQVGTDQDTMVRYIWEVHPAERLERVFVGAGLNSPLNPRWRTLIDDPEEDEKTADNAGWFGRPPPDHPDYISGTSISHRIADSTYRAAFRVRSCSEITWLGDDDSRRWDSIIIRVTARCSVCEDPPGSGNYFQNDPLVGNIGLAWDTVKPVSQFNFNILTVVGAPDFTPVSDTACINTVLHFSVRPRDYVTEYWNSDALREMFNVDRFSGHSSFYTGTTQITVPTQLNMNDALNPDYRLTGTAHLNFPLAPGAAMVPRWRTFTPQNRCFTRGRPAVTIVADTARLSTPADSIWHSITTFYVMPSAPAPLIIDPVDNIARFGAVGNTPILICQRERRDSIGNPVGGLLGDGVSFIFGMGTRDGVNPGQYTFTEAPGLVAGNVPANFLPGVTNFVSPTGPLATNFYGFSNPPGAGGNPDIFITRAWGHYVPEGGGPDPYQRMTLRLLPDPYFDPMSAGDGEMMFVFAAQNRCGRGDSTVIPFVIIDTISVFSLDPQPHFARYADDANPDTWGNLANEHHCEGETLWHRVGMLDGIERDSVFIQWRYPETWISRGPEEGLIGGSYWNQLELRFGRDPGRISVNVVCARCGGGVPIYTDLIEPIPHFRAEDYWVNFPDVICQNTEHRFTIDRAPFTNPGPPLEELMGDFFIQFPNEHWRIERNITGAQPDWRRNRDTIRREQFITQTTPPEIWFDARNTDSIGNWSEILIRWLDPRCDVVSALRPVIRPEFWDTTRFFVHTYPLAPLVGESWEIYEYEGYFTFCLRDTVWLSVTPAPKDSIQYNRYIWTFPQDWVRVDSTENNDSMRVVVGLLNFDALEVNRLDVDVITIEARSLMCRLSDEEFWALRREIGTLTVPIKVMDTVEFEMSFIANIESGDPEALDIRPCPTNELKLIIDRPYFDTIDWRWGATRTNLVHLIPDDPYDTIFGAWEFTDKTLLPDAFAFVPTENSDDTLFVQVAMRNRCGWTRSPIIDFVIAEAIDPDPPAVLVAYGTTETTFSVCEGESVTFRVETVPHAGQYIWYLRWGLNQAD